MSSPLLAQREKARVGIGTCSDGAVPTCAMKRSQLNGSSMITWHQSVVCSVLGVTIDRQSLISCRVSSAQFTAHCDHPQAIAYIMSGITCSIHSALWIYTVVKAVWERKQEEEMCHQWDRSEGSLDQWGLERHLYWEVFCKGSIHRTW